VLADDERHVLIHVEKGHSGHATRRGEKSNPALAVGQGGLRREDGFDYAEGRDQICEDY